MSKIGDLLTGAVAGLAVGAVSNLVSALLMSGRSIGGVIPDVTIEERHEDELEITEQPVEQGAAITDHSYKKPSVVTMTVSWSNSNALINSIVSGSLLRGEINDANDFYRKILELQESRVPFDLVTGKRTYNNMLIRRVTNLTDADSENCVNLEILLRQVIIVQATSVTLSPVEDQASPELTGAVQNAGTKQPLRAIKQSALNALFGG